MSTYTSKYSNAEIWTEGKTDWKILKRALEALGLAIWVSFHETDQEMGDDKLLSILQTFAQKYNPDPMIFIFDHDNPRIIQEVNTPGKSFKDWGNNIFSFSIPIPDHRTKCESVSIELYFSDDELQRNDRQGRRLYLSSEFNERSGNSTLDSSIHIAQVGVIKGFTNPSKAKVIDFGVFNKDSLNIALPKSEFATYIEQSTAPYHDLDFSQFNKIFEIIQEIIDWSRPKHNVYLPDLNDYFRELEAQELSTQFFKTFSLFIDTITLGLYIFSISTIRFYEDQIINEPVEFKSKVKPIKEIISEAFRQPSLNIIIELSKKCFYLVNNNAPEGIREMKSCLSLTITLEEIGQMLDDLNLLFPSKHGERHMRYDLRRDLLMEVFPLFGDIASSTLEVRENIIESAANYPTIKLSTWQIALEKIVGFIKPLFSFPIIFRSIKNYDPVQEQYSLDVKVYRDNKIEIMEEKAPKEAGESEMMKTSELSLDQIRTIQVYPFLFVRKDALFMYRKTRSSGYEFYSPALNEYYLESTKKKFSFSVFKIGSKQELFWTDVLPRKNMDNGICANIPKETSVEFVGRRKQINWIKENIIEIINENGILYGPGGIGKTELMIRLTKELFEEKAKENILYDNILWVSAKSDFYDYIFDSIETRDPQVGTLDNILIAILRFFNLGDLEEYSFEDRKALVMELLKDYKVLLVLDNFETIKRPDQEKILDFFGTTIKRLLRDKPGNFKIILTSREMIPAGFRQIELNGLDHNETIKLISSIYKRYKLTHPSLTKEQQKFLHEISKGIPIIIKHCLARIFEYNETFDAVVRDLPNMSSKIVQFSYKEILEKIEREKDQIGLKILLLFEVVGRPLMLRQITDILEEDELKVEGKIPILTNFECIKRLMQDKQEKYTLNDEIQLLTKSLIREHPELYREIRRQYFRNFSLDRQMDFSSEEEDLINTFETYIKDGLYVEAEDFIRKELGRRKDSVLLNFYYAKYLKQQRRNFDEAIGILERMRELSRNHPTILKELFSCYASLEIPNFEKAENLLAQLEADIGDVMDIDLKTEIARFLVRWSMTLKLKKGIDPYEDYQRISRYKELALNALGILLPIEREFNNPKRVKEIDSLNKAEIYYLLAQCHHNSWNDDDALRDINKAIALALKNPTDNSLSNYEKFKKSIQSTKDFYEKNPWADAKA